MKDTKGRPTLPRVAARAGVSVMTSSYADSQPGRVSDEARRKVLKAAAELGYAGPDPSARSLRRGSTRSLGVVMGEHLTYAFDDPQAVSFLAGVAGVCAEAGHGLTLVPITGADDDGRRIAEAAVDGFIVWTTSDDDPALEAVRSTRRPAVVHGGPAVPGLDVMGIDDRAAARAVGLVVFAGARRPAVVSQPLSRDRVGAVLHGGDIGEVLFPVTRHRLAGYREAAEELGLVWDDVVVAVCARNGAAEGEEAAARLLSRDQPPDAIAAMSDEQAVGVLRAVRAAGLSVPDDVAVTGWDDAPAARALDLTTVAQSLREHGAACARAVLGQGVASYADRWSVVRRGSTRS